MKLTSIVFAFLGASLFLAGCSSSGQAATSLNLGPKVKPAQAKALAAMGLPVPYKDFLNVLEQTAPGQRRAFLMSNRTNIARLTPSDKERFKQIMSPGQKG